jgi:hypothetical protein
MYLKKAICLFLLAAAILATAVSLDRYQRDILGTTQAEGGAPPAPPIPLGATAIDSPRIIAEGGAPPAPPIPFGTAGTEIKFARA